MCLLLAKAVCYDNYDDKPAVKLLVREINKTRGPIFIDNMKMEEKLRKIERTYEPAKADV